jgi:putative endopeptidase
MSVRILLFAAFALVALASPSFAQKPMPSQPQIGRFGFDTAGMDSTIKPGDDFAGYANGRWERSVEIPADRPAYGMFEMLDDLSRARSRDILETAARTPGTKIGDFYASFMDEAAADAMGIRPIAPWLAAIKQAPDASALAGRMGALLRAGVRAPFSIDIDQDDGAPDSYIVKSFQSGLGLPDRDYFLRDDPKLAAIRTAYAAYLTSLFTLAGEPDAAARAAGVFDFEKQLAMAQWSRIESRDVDKTYNKWARADFARNAPGFDWTPFFAAAGVDRQSVILVAQPSAFAGSARVIATTPLAVLRDYVLIRTIDAYAPFLSKPFVDAQFGFSRTTLGGIPLNEPRWKRGVSLVSGEMGQAVGEVYVARYFPPAAKAAADRLVHNIIAAMADRLRALDWMAPETKQKALIKLASFRPKIGYPDTWRDYSALVVRRDDLVGNVRRGNEFEWQRNLDKLGKPVDRGEWFMTPMAINAYATPTMNEVVFPAAILQPPFFDPNADPAVNYGAIGAVIGHELSHHFDDQGRKYDASGKLSDWWTPDDVRRFTARTDALVRQYDGYEPLPGQHVQGALTLGENIADLAGLTVAHDAYHRALGDKPAAVIDGLTGDQRFYLGWAQIWRSKYREPHLRRLLLSDPHSPKPYRILEARNLDPWYEAFAVKPGDKLYLAPAERVRIW